MRETLFRTIPRQRYVLLALAAIALLAGYGVYEFGPRRGALPDGLIQANGRIEGDAVTVASKLAGRIARIEVYEGQTVRARQLLVQLDDAQLRARVDQAAAAVVALESQVASAQLGIGVMREEVPLAIDAARAGVGRATAALDAANTAERQARRDADRLRDLVAKGFVSSQLSERAQLALDASESESTAAREALVQSRKQLAQAELGSHRIQVKEAELLTLQAQVRQAQATLAEAESLLNDLTIRAPAAGLVAIRMREPGEVVGAGAPLLEVVNLDQLYLKVYVPEAQIGRLRLGLPAQIYTDAFPNRPFEATVRHISARAEFTPKEVQTPDERVKLVYAVKLYLKSNPEHRLTPGLPADAVVRWKEDVAWAKPRW